MIATLPFMHTLNYGAELQGYALQHKLRLMGYDSVAMDIARPHYNRDARSSHLKITYNPPFKKRLYISLLSSKSWIEGNIIHPYRTKRRWKGFNEFSDQYKKSTSKFRSFDELYRTDFPYTHYIVGGDQMWNFHYPYALDPFFMTFAKSDAKRIAYAVSLGVKSIPNNLQDKYRSLLAGMDFISTRETHGADIVRDLTGKEVPTLIDPTLLLSKQEWCQGLDIDPKTSEEPYLAMYLINVYEPILQLAEEEAAKRGLKIKLITTTTRRPFRGHPNIEVLYDASPKDFVRLFAGASFAVINSFHGTVFSLNFNIPFWCVVNPKAIANSRFESILGLTGLTDRMIILGDKAPDTNEVDFTQANHRVETERRRSEEYLRNALL